ncbi:hypothetical protein C2845_PM13G12030 [Panicum miliaceum]|uniref:Uncharacterized protein n=1 Tax=Panicum miliaceum TaxID=4540 RepID=A0A3L6RGZ9_PANMI|nr:hypothetical protein C2845_PM13G12030 [Panicum miliaceum]
MEKRLMTTRVPRMLQDIQDLSLKSFIAARCVARQLEAEALASARAAAFEEKVATLEKEKLELQDMIAKKDVAVAALRDEATTALALRDKYSQDLAAAQVKAELVEAHVKNMEKNREKSWDFFRRYR